MREARHVAIWFVAAFDAFFLGFCVLMIVSKRARFGFTDWLDRRMERRQK